MHFAGDQTIKASMPTIWAFFMDPNAVAQCAPGFKSMEILSPTHFKPTLAVGVGAIKATFTLDVTLVDMQEPSHAVMKGRGNAAGSGVDMTAAMDLTPTSDSVTEMHWTADVNVSGAIASMGARLLEGTAHKLTDQFFDCIRVKLDGK